jgi:hypothetical protein
MHRILFLPDIRLIQKPDTGYPIRVGYPVRVGYRISGQIFVLTTIFLVKYKINFFPEALTIKVFSKHKTEPDLVTKLIFEQIFSFLSCRKNK